MGVEAAKDYEPINHINKKNNLPEKKLQWFEFGEIHRLPRYKNLTEFIDTAKAVKANLILLDKNIVLPKKNILSLEKEQQLIDEIRKNCESCEIFVYSIEDVNKWIKLRDLKVDGIVVDNIPLSLALETLRFNLDQSEIYSEQLRINRIPEYRDGELILPKIKIVNDLEDNPIFFENVKMHLLPGTPKGEYHFRVESIE